MKNMLAIPPPRGNICVVSQSPTDHTFRSDVPAYRAPDRDEWKRIHGTEPRELTDVAPKFARRARAAIERDRTGLLFSEAIAAHESLANICTAVQFAAHCAETDTVFFDPESDSFWVYSLPSTP